LYKETTEVVSLLFPPLFLIPEEGNWLSYIASTTTANHATVVTTLLLICFTVHALHLKE